MRAPPPQDILLVSGPPFGSALWDGVASRLNKDGYQPHTIELLSDHTDAPSLVGVSDRLAARIQQFDSTPLLVAHGTALPVALRASSRAMPWGLVLSNGPLDQLDPVLRLLSHVPHVALSRLLLRPEIWLRYLRSSVGLRRAVINPYVMDHDMVVAVCGPMVETAEQRKNLSAFLKDLTAPRPMPPSFDGPTLLVWGNADPLYPSSIADIGRRRFSNLDQREIPGGQHLHPIERPWAIAEHILNWLQEKSTATSMS